MTQVIWVTNKVELGQLAPKSPDEPDVQVAQHNFTAGPHAFDVVITTLADGMAFGLQRHNGDAVANAAYDAARTSLPALTKSALESKIGVIYQFEVQTRSERIARCPKKGMAVADFDTSAEDSSSDEDEDALEWEFSEDGLEDSLRKLQAGGHSIFVVLRMAVAAPLATLVGTSDVATIGAWHGPDACEVSSLGQSWTSGSVSSNFSDCTVSASDNGSVRKFHCHRVVLSSASSVFSAAFSNGMREAVDRELVIQGAEPETVELLLQHAYGHGELSMPLRQVLLLYKLADQYNMCELCDMCSAWLAVANMSLPALTWLLPQASALGLDDTAASLVARIQPQLSACSDLGSILDQWQLEDVVLLLDKAGGSFDAFKAAAHWAHQKQQQQAAKPTGKRRRTTHGSAPADFDSQAAWEELLPLVDFTQSFSKEQLKAARALPGASSIHGLHEYLVEAWEVVASQ